MVEAVPSKHVICDARSSGGLGRVPTYPSNNCRAKRYFNPVELLSKLLLQGSNSNVAEEVILNFWLVDDSEMCLLAHLTCHSIGQNPQEILQLNRS